MKSGVVSGTAFKRMYMQIAAFTGQPGYSMMDQLCVNPEKVAKRYLIHCRVWNYEVDQILQGYMWETLKEELCTGL